MPLLEAIAIGKTYPNGTVANDGVSLSVAPGEVHAVVGENGAGKSTLMKILFGLEQPTRGELRLDGAPVTLPDPRAAIDRGIGMVFQHFSLVPSFRAYENVVLGSEPRAGIRFDRDQAIDRVRALSDRFRLHVDPMTPVNQLPVGQQQRVEILKALYRDARILILDEPTAVLAPQEVEELFTAIRALTSQGRTVIFIAHKLPEVLAISDRIMVMRGGRTVGNVQTRDVTEDSLATMMVGREVALRVDRAATSGKVVCKVANLGISSELGKPIAKDLSLSVRAGEILGLVGVEGNGQAELLECIAGLRPAASGSITLEGQDIVPLAVIQRRALGIASIPEDRIATGLATPATVAENLVATRLSDPRFNSGGRLKLREIAQHATDLIARFSIRASGPHVPAGTLSGGNMQKVVVARELAEQPRLLLVNQPTRGVDLGATQFIWESLARARDEGAAILLASADLSELLALSDRLVVFYRGSIVAAFRNTPDLTPETLGTFMLGLQTQDAAALAQAVA